MGGGTGGGGGEGKVQKGRMGGCENRNEETRRGSKNIKCGQNAVAKN